MQNLSFEMKWAHRVAEPARELVDAIFSATPRSNFRDLAILERLNLVFLEVGGGDAISWALAMCLEVNRHRCIVD